MSKASNLILSYLQQEGMTTQQISDKLLEDTGCIPHSYIRFYINQMREKHNICTEGDFHYIPKESTSKIVMLSTVVIGGLFLCPFILNL